MPCTATVFPEASQLMRGDYTDLIISTALRESMTTIAGAICTVWETEFDTPAVYAEHCRVNAADLAHSLMAYLPDGQFVGIGVLCRRGKRGFVLDFGVAPRFRRQGYGHRLFAALVEQAYLAGLQEVSLLVNVTNEAAMRIYRQAGFQYVREVATLRGHVETGGTDEAQERLGDIEAAVVNWFGGGKSTRPTWERDLPSLLVMADARAFENRQGLLLARRSVYFRQTEIVHLGLRPDAEPEDVHALLKAACAAFDPHLPLALLEEPLHSRTYERLSALGFRPVEQAYEMRLDLTNL